MKAVGLDDPRTGRWPYAVVQLRQDNALGTLVEHGRLPDQAETWRAGAHLPHHPRARECRVRAARRHPPQQLHQLARAARPRAAPRSEARTSASPARSPAAKAMSKAPRSGCSPRASPPPSARRDARPARRPKPRSARCSATSPAAPTPTTYQPMNVNFGLMPPLDTAAPRKPTARSCTPTAPARLSRSGWPSLPSRRRGRGGPAAEAVALAPSCSGADAQQAHRFGAPWPLGRGGGDIRPGSAIPAVLVGAAELVDRLDRPFVERQRAVAVGVELGERLAPRLEQFLQRDPPVLILVGARKRFCSRLLASLRAVGQLARLTAPAAAGAAAARRAARSLLGAALPQQESAGDAAGGSRRPRRRNRAMSPPSRGDPA